jgi:hypothetical protein
MQCGAGHRQGMSEQGEECARQTIGGRDARASSKISSNGHVGNGSHPGALTRKFIVQVGLLARLQPVAVAFPEILQWLGNDGTVRLTAAGAAPEWQEYCVTGLPVSPSARMRCGLPIDMRLTICQQSASEQMSRLSKGIHVRIPANVGGTKGLASSRPLLLGLTCSPARRTAGLGLTNRGRFVAGNPELLHRWREASSDLHTGLFV